MRKLLDNKPKNTNSFPREEPFLSIANFKDIRRIFGSKEWIYSYYSIFKPKEISLIKTEMKGKKKNIVLGFQKSSENKNILVPLGTPYNDYNFVLPKTLKINRHDLEIAALSILRQMEDLRRSKYKIHLDLLFDYDEINILKSFSENNNGLVIVESSTPGVRCVYENTLKKPDIVEKSFSQKLLRRIKKQLSINKFTLKAINGQDPNYQRALQNLLLHRKINFLSQNKEDHVSAFTTKFEQFIKTLIKYPSVKPRTTIFELTLNKKYVASDLFFNYQNIFLCYLRTFNRKDFSKISPGMILSYLIHKALTSHMNCVIIDYTRGDELYKFRIGGKRTTLYRLIFN